MIRGVQVTVSAPQDDGQDELGNRRLTWGRPMPVGNVLVSPASSQDLAASRPDGDATVMVFHFPKTYTGSLRGCRIQWNGADYEVMGNPQAYMDHATPTLWDRPVQARLVEG